MTRPGTVSTFWALSDQIRIEILDRVAAGTEVTVTQLARVMPITRQAVSRHIATLEGAGLVVGERDGREQVYRIDLEPIGDAGRWLNSRSASWGRALTRLADFVEAEAGEDCV